MPTPTQRPSITTTLDIRYAKQHAGGAFEVKQILGSPGQEPAVGKVIDAASHQGAINQNPNGFQVKVLQQVSQLKAVQSGGVGNYSTYVKGLDTTKYHS